jgi:hypothetical protein
MKAAQRSFLILSLFASTLIGRAYHEAQPIQQIHWTGPGEFSGSLGGSGQNPIWFRFGATEGVPFSISAEVNSPEGQPLGSQLVLYFSTDGTVNVGDGAGGSFPLGIPSTGLTILESRHWPDSLALVDPKHTLSWLPEATGEYALALFPEGNQILGSTYRVTLSGVLSVSETVPDGGSTAALLAFGLIGFLFVKQARF